MQKQLQRKIDNLDKEKQELAKKEEDLKKLLETFEYFNSDNSKKYLNIPTFDELLKYEEEIFDENDKIIPTYKNLEYDLIYFNFILDMIGEYDFIVPCPLFTKRKIRPENLSNMKITDTYIDFIETLRDQLKEGLEKQKLN